MLAEACTLPYDATQWANCSSPAIPRFSKRTSGNKSLDGHMAIQATWATINVPSATALIRDPTPDGLRVYKLGHLSLRPCELPHCMGWNPAT